MSKKRKKSSLADSPTGTMDRPNVEEVKRQFEESPQPPVAPEAELDESITGVMSVKDLMSEGEDEAKDDDDSPTKSATKV